MLDNPQRMKMKTAHTFYYETIPLDLQRLLRCQVAKLEYIVEANSDSGDRLVVCEEGPYLYGELVVKDNGGLESLVANAYRRITHLLEERGKVHLWRCWNFVPCINGIYRGENRYHQFCSGRYEALIESGFVSEEKLCAASAVGTDGDDIVISFLASNRPGLSVDNASQVKAYHYPARYGKHSPSFARGYLAGGLLFISGTASIIGHESQYDGDLAKQLEETKKRLDELTADHKPVQITSYVRFENDIEEVKAFIMKHYNEVKNTNFVKANICRKELLVEIEMIAE